MKLYFSIILKNVQALLDPRNFPFFLKEIILYLRDARRFKKVYTGSYPIRFLPLLFERTKKSVFDPHYVYQAYWAMHRIAGIEKPEFHVDLSSNIQFLAQLSAMLPVIQLEYRPANVNLPSCNRLSGDILNLPFSGQSLKSVSCLHVIEHIGLGRYGDPLDKNGCWNALLELQRVVEPGGSLFLSVPVGNPVIYFNANYVFNAIDIKETLSDFELVEFSYVDDDGDFFEGGNLEDTFAMKLALGLFHFKRTKN